MNFLWIYQVIVIIFILKIHFPFVFSGFRVLWTGHSIKEKGRVLGVKYPRHSVQSMRMAGWFVTIIRSFLQTAHAEGVWSVDGRPIKRGWPGLDPSHREPVRARDGWIKDLRHGFNNPAIAPDSPASRSTAQIEFPNRLPRSNRQRTI
jgi:hypothetical protein